jgi:hypothetical protein
MSVLRGRPPGSLGDQRCQPRPLRIP